jgi:hypothetical protein
VPDQLPLEPVSTDPTFSVPDAAGAVVFAGAAATVAVAGVIHLTVPAEFVALTSSRISFPRSAVASEYVVPLAPEMLEHEAADDAAVHLFH